MPTVTDRLLNAASDVWEGYHTHPFVRGIADGSLDVRRFQFYLVQDYLYLYDYARVFAMGVAKARRPADMRTFAGYVDTLLNGEMEIHKAYMARLGISEQQAETARTALANASYTAYMRAVAAEQGVAEIIAAVLSCAVSYEHIARRIIRDNPNAEEHPFYGEWVRGYASDGYAAANRALEAFFERLTAHYTEEQLANLEEIFVCCSRYEAGFWDMAWRMEQ